MDIIFPLDIINALPSVAGVYFFYDKNDILIYIGKVELMYLHIRKMPIWGLLDY